MFDRVNDLLHESGTTDEPLRLARNISEQLALIKAEDVPDDIRIAFVAARLHLGKWARKDYWSHEFNAPFMADVKAMYKVTEPVREESEEDAADLDQRRKNLAAERNKQGQ